MEVEPVAGGIGVGFGHKAGRVALLLRDPGNQTLEQDRLIRCTQRVCNMGQVDFDLSWRDFAAQRFER